MRTGILGALAAAAAIGAAACVTPSQTPGLAPVVRADGATLQESFVIPGEGTSHTPAVVFTADGRMLTATSASVIAVFDVATRKLVQEIYLPERAGDGLSIDAAGRYAAWTLNGGGVAVMELATQMVLARESLNARWVALAPDGCSVAVAAGRSLELRQLPELKLQDSLAGHNSEITNVAWSANGELLGATAEDGRLLVWRDRRLEYEVRKSAPLYAVAFHPADLAVAYGGKDMQVYQYGFTTRREEVISKGQPYWITALGYSPDGEMLAVGDESCDIWLYRVKPKELTFHNKHHNECWLSSVAWAADGETFLFGCRPNAHAGRPSLHGPIVRAEAARSQAVRESRAKLLAAIDACLASERDATKRESLEECRRALEREEHPGAVDLPAQTTFGRVVGIQFGMIVPWAKPLDELVPSELHSLAQEHAQALQREVERLKGSFRVNAWKAKK